MATPLKSMGSITVPESTTLLITPFDRTAIKDIERALQVCVAGRCVAWWRMVVVDGCCLYSSM